MALERKRSRLLCAAAGYAELGRVHRYPDGFLEGEIWLDPLRCEEDYVPELHRRCPHVSAEEATVPLIPS